MLARALRAWGHESMEKTRYVITVQAPVVQKVDSAMRWIKL